jgi:hypothetical protein
MSQQVTYRNCIHLLNGASEIKARGGFKFRCALAGILMEAQNAYERYNEAKKPNKGMEAFREEIELHTKNCTSEKDGKKTVDVEKLTDLINSSKTKHQKALDQFERDRKEANKELDSTVELCADPIPESMLEAEDDREHFEVNILTVLRPFVCK